MRIIYGVSGEGSGHAMRSREVLRHLRDQGHEVTVVTYDRGLALLGQEFTCVEVAGLTIDYQHNAVKYLPTLWKNMLVSPQVARSIQEISAFVQEQAPDLLITDFEPTVALQALRHNVPLLSIDNIHQIFYGQHYVPWRYRHERAVARAVAKLMVPSADRYVVTTLTGTGRHADHAAISFPIVRPSVMELTPTRGSHVLVYDSFRGERIPQACRELPCPVKVYGYGRSGREGNLEYCEFSEDQFLADLASAQAVMGTAGFTLISEALILQKPYLAFPIAHQFEQLDNALLIRKLGYGDFSTDPSPAVVNDFFAKLASYQEAVARYRHPGLASCWQTIDQYVKELVQG